MSIRISLAVTLLVQSASVAWTQEPKDVPFQLITIDANPPDNPWFKMVGDVDGDADIDIIVAGSKGPLVWYANPSWRKRQIADGGWDGVNGEAIDLDADGDIDMVMGGVVWFENPSSLDKAWKQHRIDSQRAHDIEIADLDGDEMLDVVARDQSAFGKSGNRLYIYYQLSSKDWRRCVIDCPHGEGLKVGDLDRDGDSDIVLGQRWYENPGDSESRWAARQFTSRWTEPDAKVVLADFDGDGRTDIILTPAELAGERSKICWYEAPEGPRHDNWTEHVMIDSIECVIHSLGVGDLDGDGDVDVAIAQMHQGTDPDEVSILFNDDEGESWRKQVISDRGSHDLLVVDIDADGDLDVLGANHGGVSPLQLWRNERQAAAPVPIATPFTGLTELNPPQTPPEGRPQAIVGATLIDGTGRPPVEDSAVIVDGSRIVAIGSRKDVTIPADATLLDAAGLTLLPGLIDSHFHVGADPQQVQEIPRMFLQHGVTAARDPGRPIEDYAPILHAIHPVPRLFLTGPHFDQAPPAYPKNAVIIKDPADARRATRQYHRQGASAIKVYYRLPLNSIQATCETAAELGIPVTAHLELVDADQAIRAGLRGIEHVTSFGTVLAEPELAETFRTAVSAENEARRDGRYRLWAALNLDDSLRAKKLLTLVVERGVFVSPTLATFERRAGDAGAEEFHVRGFENMMRFVGQCHRAGATIVTGSHTWSPKVELGWAYQREMELLLESGLPPMEVIKASTINNARFLGCADRVGTLEEGKLADLVLVKGDPLREMKAMYNIRGVMLNGRWVREESR